jgi:tetratricopeptide (TPR) repeat protein
MQGMKEPMTMSNAMKQRLKGSAKAAMVSSLCLVQGGRSGLKRLAWGALGGCAIALTSLSSVALADPFRPSNPHNVGDRAEAAFEAMFGEGDYVVAQEILRTAEEDEPLTHALRSVLAYLGEDWGILGRSATRTRETAEAIESSDPLRANLYMAMGHFFEGAYIAQQDGLVSATPSLLQKLQQVFSHLNQAGQIDPNDPELNLLQGYMDLMLAVNLPFSDPADAIARLQANGAPSYLVNRGIALGYRDLDQYNDALIAVDQALVETPENPDLLYLKAQILVLSGREQESLPLFQEALADRDQLVKQVGNRLAWEECRTRNRINNVPDAQSRTECRALAQ